MLTPQEVARLLLAATVIRLNVKEPFRYHSGILSPIYCDHRLLMSHPVERTKIWQNYVEMLRPLKPNKIAGTAMGGIAWAAWIANAMELPMVYVRGSAKEHGRKNLIEGDFHAGESYIVIEDLISTGGSCLDASAAVREAGGIVEHVAAITTYELPISAPKFNEAKIRLHTMTTLSAVLEVAVEQHALTSEDAEQVRQWSTDAEGWGRNMGYE